MARQAREMSDSGFMHVIVRGIGRQLLFEAEEDYTFYHASPERYSRDPEVKVCAYCLMGIDRGTVQKAQAVVKHVTATRI